MTVHLRAYDLRALCGARSEPSAPSLMTLHLAPNVAQWVTCERCRLLHDLAVELEAKGRPVWWSLKHRGEHPRTMWTHQPGGTPRARARYVRSLLWSRRSLQLKAEAAGRVEQWRALQDPAGRFLASGDDHGVYDLAAWDGLTLEQRAR